MPSTTQTRLTAHVAALRSCDRCPAMHKPVVTGEPVVSKVMLVGQAPGVKEPQMGRPFAWTAGRTLFRWFNEACGMDEAAFRERIYMAAVCRCFPGKKGPGKGGDRVPDLDEVARCADWLDAEIALLRPRLVIPVGKLAITQFVAYTSLTDHVGRLEKISRTGHRFDLIALPHPSGASPWPRMEPGKTLMTAAMQLIAKHPAMKPIIARR